MKNILLLLLASIMLAGCTAQTVGTVAPVSSPASTAASLPSPTRTQPPTSTQEPAQTPDPILVTQQAAMDSCRGNSQDSIGQFITRGYSATRFWEATVCQDHGVYTKVEKLGKDKVFKIPAVDTDAKPNGPDWVWEPYLWSVDEDYLYLTPRYLGTIENPAPDRVGGYGLLQLDLSNGERNVFLQPRTEGYTFALSEDGRLFAFLSNIPRNIVVRDVKIKEEHQLNFKERYKILEMRWTPDGARLIILTEEATEDPAQGGYSIFEYSLEGDDLTKLVDKNNLNSLYSSDPSAQPQIKFSGLSNDVLSLSGQLQDMYFAVDLRTGDVSQTNVLGTPVATP